MADAGPILEVAGLSKHFSERRRLFSGQRTIVKAVDRVTLTVRRGEVLGLVGESGCGKTTLGRTVARLYRATAGRITYYRAVGDGAGAVTEVPLHELEGAALRELRRDIQVVFQDPVSSLNARWEVRAIVAEPLLLQGLGRQVDVDARVTTLLRMVGLSPDHMRRFPHEFSGGQRQRIGIARALALEPKLVIADEPVSALDVSIQAQVLNLIEDLQRDLQFTALFVAHDLLVVQYISDRIAVMYLGRIMSWRPPMRCSSGRFTPTLRLSCRRCRCPPCAAAAGASCSSGTCRRRPPSRPAARSILAARTHRPVCATARCRSCASCGRPTG